jgi:nicotinamidase-related amidase
MGSWWASFLLDGDPGAEFGPDPAPAPGESVFEKDAYSAYRGTGLEAWLRQGGCRSVVIAGFLTHVCVDTTARDAFMRGFDVVVASDACAAPCWRGLDLHATALAGLGHAVARVLPSERILDAMAHGPRAGS